MSKLASEILLPLNELRKYYVTTFGEHESQTDISPEKERLIRTDLMREPSNTGFGESDRLRSIIQENQRRRQIDIDNRKLDELCVEPAIEGWPNGYLQLSHVRVANDCELSFAYIVQAKSFAIVPVFLNKADFEVTPRILDRLCAYFEALLFSPRGRREVAES